MADEPSPCIDVTVAVACADGSVTEIDTRLAAGAMLRDALRVAGVAGVAEDAQADVGVWGHGRSPDTLLRAGDRVEVYRPLQVDPKVSRRARFQRQGARATGLFAAQREGAKAGY